MNWKKAFTYMFLDKEFPMIFIIGSLLLMVGCLIVEYMPKSYQILGVFLGLIITGFWCLTIKNCNSSIDKVLPNWFRDFKKILILGS